jgi:hypothetical protein
MSSSSLAVLVWQRSAHFPPRVCAPQQRCNNRDGRNAGQSFVCPPPPSPPPPPDADHRGAVLRARIRVCWSLAFSRHFVSARRKTAGVLGSSPFLFSGISTSSPRAAVTHRITNTLVYVHNHYITQTPFRTCTPTTSQTLPLAYNTQERLSSVERLLPSELKHPQRAEPKTTRVKGIRPSRIT